jgi:hypothetical protein
MNKYMQSLFASNSLEVLEHIEQPSGAGKAQQDIWILEKK